ncbi:hypothetical protein ACFIOY_38960 [Bradyrhizobium sp. TZ2]
MNRWIGANGTNLPSSSASWRSSLRLFCCDKARAFLNEPAAAIAPTCSHLTQVPDELLAHLIEIVSTALGLGDDATRKHFAEPLRANEAMGRCLIKTCHFAMLRTSS